MHPLKRLLRNSNAREWVGLLALMALSVSSVMTNYDGHFFLTSVTSYTAAPFDGTVMPIQKTPDWSNLKSGEDDYTYSQLSSSKFVTIPEYRNDYLTYPSADLKSYTGTDALIRNTKITYPTPYAGNYMLNDCGEGCGSHPAVDIKTLRDTPVYAIANGVVSDAGTSSSWGNYIVIEHRDVPNPASPSQTTTLYSSYSHLDELFVADNQVVSKGAVIGEVGDTGTATTDHLHFQIDTASAPWHPYWPFTTAEANAAGYDFWDAVNYGVGMDNLYKYTTNPLDFVQDNLDASATIASTAVTTTTTTTSSTDTSTSASTDTSTVTSTTSEEDSTASSVVTINFESMRIDTPYFAQPGQNPEVTLSLLDGNGEIMTNGTFDGSMTVTVSDENVGKLNRSSLTMADFSDGVATLNFYADHEGEVTLAASTAGRTYTSSLLYVVDNIEPFHNFGVAHDGYFVPGKAELIQIQAQDMAGNPTPSFNKEGTIELSIVSGSGTLEPSRLDRKDFPTGIAEVTFTGDSNTNVVIRVTYGTKEADSKTLESRLFSDLDTSNAYYSAVSFLFDQGTVEGYPDGSFQPDRTVSRVEALKFIFSGMEEGTQSGLSVHFSDTYSSEWYYNFLASAYSIGVVQGYSDGSFKPSQGVNRVEFLKMLLNTVDISVDPVVGTNPYEDVDNLSWYAPYVQYAKEKNLFPISGSYFNPSDPMSRLEVAEVIYRMITVNDNDDQSYSVLLRPENP